MTTIYIGDNIRRTISGKTVSIVSTSSGPAFSKRIARSLIWRREHGYCDTDIAVNLLTVNELHRISDHTDTLIHSRAAHPNARWMDRLSRLNECNVVVNSPRTLKLTSDKLKSSLLFANRLPEYHPKTWEYVRGEPLPTLEDGCYVIKPYTSIAQGANVRKFRYPEDDINDVIADIPGSVLVLQEFVPYTALHRVIVIGGQALPYTFVDTPTLSRWRVSVCLNRETMAFNGNPDFALLRLGEEVQRIVRGQINFIDLFEVPGGYKIGEINTACNLRIHELLAKENGRTDWNIHYRIAKFLEGRVLEL